MSCWDELYQGNVCTICDPLGYQGNMCTICDPLGYHDNVCTICEPFGSLTGSMGHEIQYFQARHDTLPYFEWFYSLVSYFYALILSAF